VHDWQTTQVIQGVTETLAHSVPSQLRALYFMACTVGTGHTAPGVPGVVAFAAADGVVMDSCPLAARAEKGGDLPNES
jgi:hypothetical protein